MEKKKVFRNIRYTLYGLVVLCMFLFYYLLVNPIIFGVDKEKLEFEVAADDLRKHVEFMTDFDVKHRTYLNTGALNSVADYIYTYFKKTGCDRVSYQTYEEKGVEFKNVICNFDGNEEEKIVIGAHYDVFGEYSWSEPDIEGNKKMMHGTFAGADDNASGVAGLLELAYLLGKGSPLNNPVELVAYTLEEPPHFDSEMMGSYVHAKSLYDKQEKIKYMIALEMIGYFSDEEIQEYPFTFLKWFYPNKGNFIAIIGELFDPEIKDMKKKMLSYSDIDARSLSAPKFIPGIDFSDHRNYWDLGYRAYMVTDTSFNRNKNYHTAGDTIDTLDFEKMKEVVKGVYAIVTK